MIGKVNFLRGKFVIRKFMHKTKIIDTGVFFHQEPWKQSAHKELPLFSLCFKRTIVIEFGSNFT